jgi:hypothetical protein
MNLNPNKNCPLSYDSKLLKGSSEITIFFYHDKGNFINTIYCTCYWILVEIRKNRGEYIHGV